MSKNALWSLGKLLEGIGLVVVLVGVLISMDLGFEDESLKSMAAEFRGLMWGGGLFLVGYLLERASGGRA